MQKTKNGESQKRENLIPISSHPEMFCKKGVLKDFAKLTTPKPATFLKKKTQAQVFSCEFYKIFRNIFFIQNISGGPPACVDTLENSFYKEPKIFIKLLASFIYFFVSKILCILPCFSSNKKKQQIKATYPFGNNIFKCQHTEIQLKNA